jgi:hypothetical protein
MRHLLLLIITSFVTNATAQIRDTVAENKLKADIHNRSWCIAANTGVQKTFFAGIGIARTGFLGSSHGMYGSDIYTGVNFFRATKKNNSFVTGLRLGADAFGSGFLFGAEIQYLTSKAANDFLFTPRFGIGFSGLYFVYGYSISRNKYPFAGITQNSISLQLNYPFFTNDKVKNEKFYWNGRKRK